MGREGAVRTYTCSRKRGGIVGWVSSHRHRRHEKFRLRDYKWGDAADPSPLLSFPFSPSARQTDRKKGEGREDRLSWGRGGARTYNLHLSFPALSPFCEGAQICPKRKGEKERKGKERPKGKNCIGVDTERLVIAISFVLREGGEESAPPLFLLCTHLREALDRTSRCFFLRPPEGRRLTPGLAQTA